MKNKALYIGLLFVTLNMVSCDDFLQKDPPSSPSESIYWKSKSDFVQALTACYSVIYDGQKAFSEIMPCYDNLTDNALCQFDDSRYGRTKTMIQGDIYPTTDGYVSIVYNTAFKAISRCNLFLFKLNEYEGRDITEEEKTYMAAQAKALRGYFYHWLFLCYKEVPVFTEFLSLDEQYQPKATRKEIYDQIMKDLGEAANELGDHTYMDAPGRITKSACLAFMARVTMFNGYSDAEGIPVGVAKQEDMRKVAELCEQVKGYDLDENIRTAFVESMQMDSKEMIFSARYGAPDLANEVNLIYAGWSSIMVQRNLVDAFECTDGLPWGESPLTVLVDEDLINSKTADKDLITAEREKLFINRDQRLKKGINAITIYRFPENPGYPDNPCVYNNEPSVMSI